MQSICFMMLILELMRMAYIFGSILQHHQETAFCIIYQLVRMHNSTSLWNIFIGVIKEMKNNIPQIYDFACQLHEYCLNREPELFKNTRLLHDLFHSIGHVCGINFESGRVRGLEGVNTEICEQWNSFLQCIKYTGSHLTQDHFSFLLQFFIALQNREKTEKFRTQASIAVAGHL